MKKLILFLSTLIPGCVFALSCPNNGVPLLQRSSIQQVLQTCGQPASQNSKQQTINISEQWTYYIPSKKRHKTNDKVTMTFNHGKLVNINLVKTYFKNGAKCQITNNLGKRVTIPCSTTEQNLRTFTGCHRYLQTGAGASFVQNACGNPSTRQVLASKTIHINELAYPNTAGPSVLEFTDGQLTGWKY